MMSEPRRLHPISIIFELFILLKQVIIPLLLWFVVFLKDSEQTGVIRDYAPWIGLGILLLLMTVVSIIKWRRYTYWVENRELRIEYGLFVRKKRYIPFDRIQSLDFSEGILHRPFGLVKVKVETAGANDDKAEADLTAVKLDVATRLKSIVAEARDSQDAIQGYAEIKRKETMLYKITRRQLLFVASTSGRAGLVISAILAFGAQFDEWIPFDKIWNEMSQVVRAGYFLLTAIVLGVLVLSWGLSVVMVYLKYNGFTLRHVGDDFVITRGLLEKRTITIPIRKVQAVRIIESPIRQPFGYACVVVEYAGGANGEEHAEGMLMPIVRKKDIGQLLQATLADYLFAIPFHPAPKRAKRRFYLVNMILATFIAAGLTIWLGAYGALAFVLLPMAWGLGIWRYRSVGWNITENQLTVRYRVIAQQTVLLKKHRMQSLDVTVNWWQNRADLATVSTAVMSVGNAGAGVVHIDKQDAATIYEWYAPKKRARGI